MTIVVSDDSLPVIESTINPFKQPTFAFIDRIRALNWKNITGIRRNLSMLIIQFLMPSFQCLLNFTCLGPDPYDIPVAILNMDSPPILSGLFINNLNNITFRLIEFDDYDEDKEDPNKDMGATDEEDAVIDVVTPHSNDVFLSRYVSIRL